jgi:hypothetical protein
LVQRYEINRSRPEARSLLRWDVTPVPVGFPHAQQAAELKRFIDRPSKTKDTKEKAVEREFLLTSLAPSELNAAQMLDLDRDYWGIESGLHQRLDVSGLEDKSRVRTRQSAFNLCLFRRAANSFAVHWIQRQPDSRRATTAGFYDAMDAKGHRKAFSLVTVRKPSWLPRK